MEYRVKEHKPKVENEKSNDKKSNSQVKYQKK
jgi:hypothetical protein